MRREPWFRVYFCTYKDHADLLPCVGVSWDSGYIGVSLSWLLWFVDVQWSQRRDA